MNGVVLAFLGIAIFFVALYYFNLLVPVLVILAIALLILLFFKIFLKKYDPFEAAVVYRFGRFHRVNSGWTIVLPIIEKIGAVIDLREQKEHISVPVISKEGLKINLSTLIYFYINNAKRVILNVRDFRNSFIDLVEAGIRDISADFNFTQLLVNVEHVNELLKQRIQPILNNWGIAISTLEIEQVRPPDNVMEALEDVKISEQNLEAQKFSAEARRIVTRALGEGTKSFDDKTITYLYVKALENMKSAKMLLPAEFMDVVHGGGGGSLTEGSKKSDSNSNRLAGGMIAGTTFNKALNMITDEVKKESVDNNDDSVEEEEGAAGFDGLDGSFDGQYED
ncbi:MAG: SPFH domain-containing protein [Nanoarchaeota archaeon]|nr:SPFH domain-containing protein [Nanoarchaeota archaeon]